MSGALAAAHEMTVEERLEALDNLIARLDANVSLCIWAQRALAERWGFLEIVERIDREFDRARGNDRPTPTEPGSG